MAGILHTYIPNRVIDDNGTATGASIAFYSTGTTTPAAIYSDSDMATPLANPVVVGAGAAVPDIYLDPDITYRRVVTYSDGSTQDSDPYNGISASGMSVSNRHFTSINRTVDQWLNDWPTALNAIPPTLHEGIRARTSETDVSSYIQDVVDVMQESKTVIPFPPGRYWLENGIFIDDGVGDTTASPSIIGPDYSQRANGSRYQPVTFVYAGTGDYLFKCERSYTQFANFSVRNVGSAKYAIWINGGGRHKIENIGALSDPANILGEVRFSDALIYAVDGGLNYSEVRGLDSNAYAPVGILCVGGASAGGTRLLIEDCIWETSAWGNFSGLKLQDEFYEQVTFRGVTLNGYAGQVVQLVSTTTSPRTTAMQSLLLEQVEIDVADANAGSIPIDLKRVLGTHIDGGSFTCGSIQNLIRLDESHITGFSPGDLRGTTAAIITRVNGGATETVRGVRTTGIALANTNGLKDGTDEISIAPVAAGLTRIKINEGGDVPSFVLPFTANTTTSLVLAKEDDSVRGIREPGRVFTLTIRNTSGGALSGITLADATTWRLAGGAMTYPATGNQMAYTFRWAGTYAQELSRIETAI